MIVVLILIGLIVAGFILKIENERTDRIRSDRSFSAWREQLCDELGVREIARDSSHLIGANIEHKELAVVDRQGTGMWIGYDRIASIEVTPIYVAFNESSSETVTNRGSQLISAGIGAAIAGPAGLIVGGLSGSTTTTTNSSSSQYLSKLEIKLRFFSNELPNLTINAVAPFDEVERLAARIANAIDQRQSGRAQADPSIDFTRFETSPIPTIHQGWWQRTFG